MKFLQGHFQILQHLHPQPVVQQNTAYLCLDYQFDTSQSVLTKNMVHQMAAPYRPQQPQQVADMVRRLEASKGKSHKDKRGFACQSSKFKVEGTPISVNAWRMQDWDYKKPNLPTYARGIFTTTNSAGAAEIVTRGYDKFFNTTEVPETEWRNIERDTRGPYELSVKENGCIIFISGLEDGTLLVCSKHSTGRRRDTEFSHAQVGEKWVDRHLQTVGRTRQQLARRLREMNATAVAELCDDDFEEHVLEYRPETAGLYLHGINLNLPEFATYPHPLVDQFADEWGMKRTMFVLKDDIKEVKTFLDNIAETGNYAGRDTEGFVVRCQSKANTGEWHDWFFKYKFDEPYLMYRQWRECTKAIISGKQPRYKKHKKITADYIDFARQILHGNKELARQYMANHGIIKMREDFLASRGLKGSDIIKWEAEQDEAGDDEAVKDIVLVPVATIGCGKTTVGLALGKLFGWGQVQNDNITAKRGKPQIFATACAEALTESPAMIADRNNHQRRERKQLMEDLGKIVPTARFVCLHYVHDDPDSIRRVTQERVLSRGDNHQTIQAGSKGPGAIIEIMEGFMQRFERVRPHEQPDSMFDSVIDLNVIASSRENLETVVKSLYQDYPGLFGSQEMPGPDELDAAIESAMHDYTVDIKHEIKGRDDRPSKGSNGMSPQPNGGSKPKERKLEYFAVQLPVGQVNAVLEDTFNAAKHNVARMYSTLQERKRIQTEFHVTLIHRASSNEHPEEWQRLSDLHTKAMATQTERPAQNSGPRIGVSKVRLERIVWDGRVMAFVVRLGPAEGSEQFTSISKTAHITVGTTSPAIKPVESNSMLAKWLQEGSGENGIMEVAVNGNVELDGTVRAVLQSR